MHITLNLASAAFCDEGRKLLEDTQGIAWLEKPFAEAQLLASLEQSLAAAAQPHSQEASDHDSMQ
ncbi:hypothetical protein [Pseudomonas sp. CC6-YY-74]|uniref:hypothetical protein n=1 Tax=Pseudomonas sp. CC6-YY-74 TaxID=1930532 RepID=UPI0009A17556|nr:hypothetical protein [Pseudomonas sp. CC6-YY-74]